MHVQSVQSYCFCSLNMQNLWRFRCRRVLDLKLPIRELKHETFLSTRTATGSGFAKKLTSHVTDVKSQTSKLPIWRLWWKTKTRKGKFILGAITLLFWLIFVLFLQMLDNQLSNSYYLWKKLFFVSSTGWWTTALQTPWLSLAKKPRVSLFWKIFVFLNISFCMCLCFLSVVLNFNVMAMLRQRFQKDHVKLRKILMTVKFNFFFCNASIVFVICIPLQKCTKWIGQIS